MRSDPTNIGTCLRKLDELIRSMPAEEIIENFNCRKEEVLKLLNMIACHRHRHEESQKRCFKRLIRDVKRFEKIFQERARK